MLWIKCCIWVIEGFLPCAQDLYCIHAEAKQNNATLNNSHFTLKAFFCNLHIFAYRWPKCNICEQFKKRVFAFKASAEEMPTADQDFSCRTILQSIQSYRMNNPRIPDLNKISFCHLQLWPKCIIPKIEVFALRKIPNSQLKLKFLYNWVFNSRKSISY